MRVLDRSPAADLSLRSVAREAGVAAPSVYSQFPDAKAMLAEIVRECWRELGEAMSGRVQVLGDASALDQIKAQMSAYIRYAMERPSRYQLLFALRPIQTEIFADQPGLLRPAYRNVLASVERLVAEGVALPAPDPMTATLVIISLAHGRIALAHLAPHRSGNVPPAVETFLFDALDRLFGA